MVKDAFCYFDGERGYLMTVADDGAVTEIVTTKASPGRVILIDDGKNFPMMRYGPERYRLVLKWGSDKRIMGEHFARNCNATLLPTRAAYDRAVRKALSL